LAVAVLDASALLALLNQEPGAERVREVLAGSIVSAINCAEVYSKLSDWKVAFAGFDDLISVVPTVVGFDVGLARRAGELNAATRHLGLSLGDRACLALAEREGLPALTADRKWARLDIGIAVELIR
jgi:PIN domain nuclease of toxin-antitoxin system